MTEPADDVMDELREAVRLEVRMGITPADEIVDAVLEMFEDEDDPPSREAVEHLLRAESDAMRREQAGWPAVTDCDRLDRAFNDLEQRGVVARQHFSCCMNCGSGEIWAEVEDAGEAGANVRGYAFYHAQDTQSAAEGGRLYLAYGSVEEGAGAAIGHEIVAVLGAHGLSAEWDGSVRTRIHVPMDWKRRRDDL